MPTIAELGQKVKAKYPGSYDDIPDIELGRKIKTKYPGAYDDFTDEPVETPFVDSILRGSPGAQIPGRRQRGPVPTVRLNSSPWEQAQAAARDAQVKAESTRIPEVPMQIPGKQEILNQAAGQELQDQENQMAAATRGASEAAIPKPAIDFAAAVPGALASPFKWDPMQTRNPVNRVKAAMYSAADDPDALVRELETLPESERPAVLKQAVEGLRSDFQGGLANYVEPAKEGEPGTDTAAKAFARTLYGMASPQAMLEMTGLGLAGKATRAAANAPAVVKALANSPNARRAMAVAGEAAVPGGMALKTGTDAIEAGREAANAETDTQRTDKLTEAITSALMSVGLLGGAVKSGSKALSEFTPENAGTVGRRRRLSRDAQAAVAQAYGEGFDPTRVDPATAIQQASTLRARGSNLAADDILAKSDPGTQTFKIGAETYQLTEHPTENGRTAIQVTNSKGEVVTGGTPGQVFSWLSQRMEPTLAPGVGPAVVDAARGVEVNAKPGSVAGSLLQAEPTPAVSVVAPKGTPLFKPEDLKGGAVLGRTTTAGTSKGYRVPVQYAIIDADQAVTSHDDALNVNPEYPAERQPRTRERVASQMQIQNMIAKLDPPQLGIGPMASDGAPVLDPEGNFVESGNGRMIALKRIYQKYPAIADRYRAWLEEEVPYLGIDPGQIAGMKNPVLVRYRGALPAGVSTQQFGIDANEDTKAQLNATERAIADAQQMDDEILSLFQPGKDGAVESAANIPFATKFFSKIVAPGEIGNLINQAGQLSKEGAKRLKYALFAKAYSDPGAVEMLSEDTKSTVANLLNGMFYAAPNMASVQTRIDAGQLHPLGIGTDISRAVHRIENLRREGVPVAEYLKQSGLLEEDVVHGTLMEMFDEFKRSPRRIGQVLDEYAKGVVDQGTPNQESFFGPSEPASKGEILEAAYRTVKERIAAEEAEEEAKKNEKAQNSSSAKGGEESRAEGAGTDGTDAAGIPPAATPVEEPSTSAASADPETRVLDVLRANPGTVTGQKLRAALPDVSDQDLSNIISKLRGEDRILVSAHSDPYGEAPKDGSILDPNRKDGERPIYYAGVSLNEDWKPPQQQAPSSSSAKPTRAGRIRGVRQLLKERGGMSFREIAEATGATAEQIRDEIQKLHGEGVVEMIPAGEGPQWAEPETEMLQDGEGNRFVGARPVLAKVKSVSRSAKKKEKGAVKLDFLTGRWEDEEPTTPKFEFAKKETNDRIREAGKPTPPKEQFFTSVKELIAMFGRVYRHLPQGKYPALVFELKRLEKSQQIASQKAQEHIRRITLGLDKNQFDAFRKKVIMDDLYETLMQFVRDMKLKLPLEYDDLGNGTIRIPLDALAKSPGKEKADPKVVAQMKLDWENGALPAVIDGTYSDKNGQIVTGDADFVDAARAAKLTHVDVRVSNMADMKSDQASIDRDITFAFGQTFDEIRKNLADVSAFVQKDPKIMDSIQKRKEAWKNVRRDLITAFREAGVEIEDRLQREDYYRHRVIQNIQEKAAALQAASGGGVYTPRGRSYMRARGVNALDYSTNYIESEYEVMSQVIADTAKAKMVGFLRNPVNKLNIIEDLKQKAQGINQAAIFEEFAKKGLAASDVATWSNWRRSTLVETLAEAAATGDLPASPEFEKLRDELADAWTRHIETDRPLRLQSPTEDFVKYVGWMRAQGYAAPADLTAPQSQTDIAIRRTLNALGRPGRISERTIKEVLQHRYVNWDDLVPDTHVAWNPDQGNTYFLVQSIPETIARELLEQAGHTVGITADDLKRVLAVGARREPLVVPREVAATLNDLRTRDQKSPLTNLWRRIMGSWKRWQLISPGRLFMYNLRNMTGDLEASIVGNPRAVKKIFQAAKELWNWYRNRVATPELQAWMERGGFQSGITIQEMEDLGNDKHFRKLMEIDGQLSQKPSWNPLRMWFENVAAPVSEFREGLLRYSNFLAYREQMVKGSGRPDNFGASRPSDVMALKDVNDRAYKLSNDLLGAYDEITEGGHMLRDNLIPFWSFQELNLRRYKWLLKNAMRDGHTASMVGRALGGKLVVGAPLLALRVGASLFKILFGFWALTAAWNYLFYRDDEEMLPASVRQVPHMVLGRTQSGSNLTWTRLGNMPDLLEWLDLGENSPYFHDWLDGRINGGQLAWLVAKHQVMTPIEKIVTTSVPQVMIPVQYFSGYRFYPDLSNPRSIRDRDAFVADQLQLRWAYDFLTGKPMGPKDDKILKLIRNEFARESDPLESAYYDTKDLRREFYRRRGVEEYVPGQSKDVKKDAAYNLKLSVRRGDKEAFRKYLIEYYAAGGTKESLDRAAKSFHPLDRMKPDEKRAFIDSLQGEDRHRLVLAIRFYQEVFEKGGRLEQYIRQNSDVRPGKVKR